MARRQTLARPLAAAFAALTWGWISGSTPSVAADPTTAVIVFDGSGSMWGRLEGERQAKFAIAREALKGPMSAAKPEVMFGLASFGHRRQGDCSDAQVIVPPEAGATERIAASLDKLNPKGKGPVAAGLREASKVLGQGPGKRSLILIHDDADNCGVDVCTLLGELQSNAPGLVVHSVGLGLKTDDTAKMQCLTGPTGGKLFDARSAAQVGSAIEEVVRLAALDARPVTPAAALKPPPSERPKVAPESPGGRKPLAKDGPPALRLATLLAGETVPSNRPVRWVVIDSSGTELATVTGQDVVVPLPAGRYTVEVSDGLIERREAIAVADKGHTPLDVTLDAGTIALPSASQLRTSSAMLTIGEAAQGGRGRSVAVMAMREAPERLVLPPGKYVVGLEQGGARWQQAVDIAKGATVDLGKARPFGNLAVSVTGRDAAARPQVLLQVMVDDPEAPRGLREVARAAGAEAEFTLPAGTYAVIAKQGTFEVRDRLSIGSGDVVRRSMSFGGGQLSLSSRLPGSSQAAQSGDPVSYRISRLDVVPPQVFTSVERSPSLELPAGRYRIEARHGLLNAVATRDIDLAAGQRATVVLEQQAGQITLNPPAGHQGELFWQVMDTQRRVIWGTAQPAPRATLLAGRYIVRAETRAKTYEQTIELKSGQIVSVQLADGP